MEINLMEQFLVDKCNRIGIELTDIKLNQFITYYKYLIEKNKVMNLTTITDYEDVVLKHFIDSLSICNSIDITNFKKMIDIGTGAGFPGIPLKIVYPHLSVLLLDSLNKRISFLNETIDLLQLNGIQSIHARAEDSAKNSKYREQFDLCVSRAVANLSSLSEYCLPFLRKGGLFISYKSADVDEEIEKSHRALNILGGKIIEKKEFYLPESDIARSFIIIKKERMTPLKYPRKAGLPTKEPL